MTGTQSYIVSRNSKKIFQSMLSDNETTKLQNKIKEYLKELVLIKKLEC